MSLHLQSQHHMDRGRGGLQSMGPQRESDMIEWLSLHLFIHVESLKGSTAYFLELSEFTKTAGYEVNFKNCKEYMKMEKTVKQAKLTISPQSQIFRV